INHNTSFSSREDTFSAWGPTSGFTFTNNVLRHNRCLATFPNDCGISGNGTLPGTATLNAWLGSPVVVSGNILFDAGRDRSADYRVVGVAVLHRRREANSAIRLSRRALEPFAERTSAFTFR